MNRQIIGSVILLPNRIHLFQMVLENAKLYPIQSLYIHICKYYPRLDMKFPANELVKLYQYLENYPISYKIKFHKEDIGSCLKLYGILPEISEMSDESFVFIFDDDTCLNPKTVQQLCEKGQYDSIIGCMGVMAPHFIHGEQLTHQQSEIEVRVIGGYRGVLYPCKILKLYKEAFIHFIHDLLVEYKEKLNGLPLHDDHIFSSFFRKHNIALKIVKLDQIVDAYTILENTNGIFQQTNNYEQLNVLEEFLKQKGFEYN